jgi:hypothetical protein
MLIFLCHTMAQAVLLLIDWLMIMMQWDRRLRTAAITGLLFISRWMWVESRGGDDAGWGEVLTCLPELSVSPTIKDIWSE